MSVKKGVVQGCGYKREWYARVGEGSSSERVEDTSDVWNGRQVDEEGHKVKKLGIVWIVEPRGDRDGVVGMENV